MAVASRSLSSTERPIAARIHSTSAPAQNSAVAGEDHAAERCPAARPRAARRSRAAPRSARRRTRSGPRGGRADPGDVSVTFQPQPGHRPRRLDGTARPPRVTWVSSGSSSHTTSVPSGTSTVAEAPVPSTRPSKDGRDCRRRSRPGTPRRPACRGGSQQARSRSRVSVLGGRISERRAVGPNSGSSLPGIRPSASAVSSSMSNRYGTGPAGSMIAGRAGGREVGDRDARRQRQVAGVGRGPGGERADRAEDDAHRTPLGLLREHHADLYLLVIVHGRGEGGLGLFAVLRRAPAAGACRSSASVELLQRAAIRSRAPRLPRRQHGVEEVRGALLERAGRNGSVVRARRGAVGRRVASVG